jgi:hypothetical protein
LITDLKDGAAKLKLKLNPVFVMIGHFGQNIHKKICEKWKEQYTSDENLNSYIKQMTAGSWQLIPPYEVADAFVELSLHAP